MKIIIVGCGKVGVSLAERLSAEAHDLVMVDMNPQKVEHLSNQFDALGIVGNGASFNIQQEAGVESADLFIAVTGEDELNLLCCLMAKKTGHCDTIARVRNPLYNKEIRFIQEKLGLSMIINPELTAAREILKILKFCHQDRHLRKGTCRASPLPLKAGDRVRRKNCHGYHAAVKMRCPDLCR